MEIPLLVLTLVAAAVAAVCALVMVLRKPDGSAATRRDLEGVATRADLAATRTELQGSLQGQLDRVNASAAATAASFTQFQAQVHGALTQGLKTIQDSNEKRLAEIRGVVDEKLTATLATKLAENFNQISTLLASVQTGLGQVQTLATDVTGLRKSIDGVKLRGVFGEVMLRGLLEEFLHPAQFVVGYQPSPRSREIVEFAVKLPGQHPEDPDDAIYLPIDSKYPKESYDRLLASLETGDKAGVEAAQGELANSIKLFARDIRDKYIRLPAEGVPGGTTDFAILYLPFESLFAEVARIPGLLEHVQRTCSVTIASPTTLAALLCALRVGFRTLEIQRNHARIGSLLEVVRGQFQSFSKELDKVGERLEQTKGALEATQKRTRIMDRKLKDIPAADEATVGRMLPGGDPVVEPGDDEAA